MPSPPPLDSYVRCDCRDGFKPFSGARGKVLKHVGPDISLVVFACQKNDHYNAANEPRSNSK
jgi:hypothetical protein